MVVFCFFFQLLLFFRRAAACSSQSVGQMLGPVAEDVQLGGVFRRPVASEDREYKGMRLLFSLVPLGTDRRLCCRP